MNNYEYIIASLPVLKTGLGPGDAFPTDEILSSIRENISRKDALLLDFLLSGFGSENLNEEFYRKAAASDNRFINGYFRCDLDVRNRKVAFLNRTLGRPEGTDEVVIEGIEPDYDICRAADAVLSGSDILERERGLDDLMWKKAEDLVVLDVFNIDVILSFTARLMTAERWLRLDPESGRKMFRSLVEGLRGSFKPEKTL